MSIEFAGTGRPIGTSNFQDATVALGVDDASLWALVAVESRGFGFFRDRRPVILFERHVFHSRTNGKFSGDNPDISNPTPGGYAKGTAEYDRLEKAMGLDERAALESASWGLGQVMGWHAQQLGYADVYAMVGAIVNDEATHLQAIVDFLRGNPPLLRAFQTRTWAKVAFFYNGANYQKNHYDEKLEQNYQIFSGDGRQPNLDLRAAQACLTYLGYLENGVDGIMGRATLAALAAFRKARGIPPSVDLDPATTLQLTAAANI